MNYQPIRKQIILSLGLLLTTILFLACFLFVLGEARIDASGGDLGLYSSSLTGSPSYRNPLFSLLEITEFPALVILPLLLILLRRRVKVRAFPWLLVLLSLPLSVIFMLAFAEPVADPKVNSVATQFIMLQIVPAGVLVIGYTILAIRNYRSSNRKFIHRKTKFLT